MFPLTTNRLRLIPLTLPQLQLLSQGFAPLETSLGLALSDLDFDGGHGLMAEFRAALPNYTIPAVTAHPDQYAWYTHWLVVHQALNLIIGGIGMTGLPNAEGQVMLGYFTDKKFENAGFATEALGRLLDWVFLNPAVESVAADTLPDGLASQRVLQKNGFQPAGPSEEGLRWVRKR
jgi:RimJ/RimL family protein N-acetyltransferase